MEFEINFLVLQSQTEKLDEIREKVKKTIENRGGKITDKLEYRKRKLSYQIKHELYGLFNVLRFELEDSGNIEKIKKDLNLLQDVARYIIVRTDELPALREEAAPEQQEKKQLEEKDTIKQEDVNKILSEEKEVKEDPKKEKEAEKKEDEISKDDLKQVEKEETEKDEPASPANSAEATKTEKDSKDTGTKDEKKKESTLEDLDKKLDEILNI